MDTEAIAITCCEHQVVRYALYISHYTLNQIKNDLIIREFPPTEIIYYPELVNRVSSESHKTCFNGRVASEEKTRSGLISEGWRMVWEFLMNGKSMAPVASLQPKILLKRM